MSDESFSHIRDDGKPSMVSIDQKASVYRRAVASGEMHLPAGISLDADNNEILCAKGPVLQTAIIAGTQAVKRTSDVIPFCHPIPLEEVQFHTEFNDRVLSIQCCVGCHYKTGVEMEALHGVSVALLTVYDMCKSVGQDMKIDSIQVESKEKDGTTTKRNVQD